jgi:hypothetical protein
MQIFSTATKLFVSVRGFLEKLTIGSLPSD